MLFRKGTGILGGCGGCDFFEFKLLFIEGFIGIIEFCCIGDIIGGIWDGGLDLESWWIILFIGGGIL